MSTRREQDSQFNTVEVGITVARQTLDEVLNAVQKLPQNSGDPDIGNKRCALELQVIELEAMLMEVMDAQYARTFGRTGRKLDSTENLGLLRFIVRTAGDMWGSLSTGNPTPSVQRAGSGGVNVPSSQPPSDTQCDPRYNIFASTPPLSFSASSTTVDSLSGPPPVATKAGNPRLLSSAGRVPTDKGNQYASDKEQASHSNTTESRVESSEHLDGLHYNQGTTDDHTASSLFLSPALWDELSTSQTTDGLGGGLASKEDEDAFVDDLSFAAYETLRQSDAFKILLERTEVRGSSDLDRDSLWFAFRETFGNDLSRELLCAFEVLIRVCSSERARGERSSGNVSRDNTRHGTNSKGKIPLRDTSPSSISTRAYLDSDSDFASIGSSQSSSPPLIGVSVQRSVSGLSYSAEPTSSQPPPYSQQIPDTNTMSCVICRDHLVSWEQWLGAPCGHKFCHNCATNLVETYAREESLHPLRCCNISIPKVDIEKFTRAPSGLKTPLFFLFQDKHEEYTTSAENRIYCPNTKCGKFVKPSLITRSGTKVDKVRCPSCVTGICVQCKEDWHPGEPCDINKNTIRVRELAKERGWQTCAKCKRIVERVDGCLHMTCLCGYEFCYRCGAKYVGPGMCGH